MAFLAIVSKLISYVFYCFMNFLCISLFFWPCLLFFFGEICGRHFFKHNNAKIISAIESKNKHIYMNYAKKNSIRIDFVHKITFLEPLSVRRACTNKLRNFRTVHPGVTNLRSKCAANSKETSPKVSPRELCALQSNRAKCRKASLFRVKDNSGNTCYNCVHTLHMYTSKTLCCYIIQ